ncbi:hypothetical protein PGIGA_G00227800 [Pangasianodon gigas]|uniref:Uncharacterized protein n=1 Tax=Pangasianodon gigas TaxID=30993 RepID=A0ACC5WJW7_PANGG|nr:hypothetical protein [Pangasianodon gigas]
MSLDWGRKPEYPQETPEARGEPCDCPVVKRQLGSWRLYLHQSLWTRSFQKHDTQGFELKSEEEIVLNLR